MRILDRYVLRNFLEPFALCFMAFLGILMVFDLNDNLSDFIGSKAKWKQILGYYAHQLPNFVLLSMPIGILLATLYGLSKMSRANEVISMLSAGRSVFRVILPLLVCGALLAGGCMWLNYELAPQADAMRKADIEAITKGEAKAEQRRELTGYLAKDRMTNRVWFTRRMRPGDNTIEGVHITQLDGEGNPVKRWYGAGAVFNPRADRWGLVWGRIVDFDELGNVKSIDDWSDRTIHTDAAATRSVAGWSETPYRISSASFEAEQLSVPDLQKYLLNNADFPERQLAPFRTHLHYRWALPLTCLTVIFIAAPLGIVFSRRAVLAAVAGSIFIFFGYLFSMFLFLALGKGGHLPPWVAGWAPNAALFTIGLYLLWLRSTNRELPRLFKR